MRFLLALLSFVALAFAPLATPAQAMAGPAAEHCAEMAGGSAHGPAKPQMPDDSRCCVAVPAALPSSVPSDPPPAPLVGPAVLSPVAQLTGLSAEAEDPPPRS